MPIPPPTALVLADEPPRELSLKTELTISPMSRSRESVACRAFGFFKRFLPDCRFAPLPIEHGDLFLLARREWQAVEQPAHRIAIGDPFLFEMKNMTMGDSTGLVNGRIVVPVDWVTATQPRTVGRDHKRFVDGAKNVEVLARLGGVEDRLGAGLVRIVYCLAPHIGVQFYSIRLGTAAVQLRAQRHRRVYGLIVEPR